MPSCALLWSWTWLTLRLVPFHRVLSCAVTFLFYAVIFMRSWLCRLCCNHICVSGCAMTRSHKNGADLHLIGQLHAQSNSPMQFTLGTPTLRPIPNLCPQSNQSLLPPPPCEQKGETATGRKKTLERQELPGGSQSFLVIHRSLGVPRKMFAIRGYRMLHRVILGPRSIFLCSAYIWYVQHGICMWSQLWTNF